MYLGGQAGQRGYAMAALLMSVGIMAIVMSALLPVWRQQSQREKEAELAFRGEQYARAIYLFSTKNGGQYPPSIDALVQGRYLRKKYKDPMTEDGEFQPLAAGSNQPGIPGGRGNPPTGGTGPGGSTTVSGRIGGGAPQQGRGGPSPGLGGGLGGVQAGGGIITVVSKSKEPSIRIYNGAAHYNEWQFRYNRQGRGGAPGRGGPGGGPTQGMPGRGGPGSGQGGTVGAGGVGGGGTSGGPRGTGPGGRQGGARGGGAGRGGGSVNR